MGGGSKTGPFLPWGGGSAALNVPLPLDLPVVLCVTDIPSINGNDTLFCSELNGEHADESFMSLRVMFFRCANVKLKSCRFCENLTFDLS